MAMIECVRPLGCYRPSCMAEGRCRMDPSHPRFAAAAPAPTVSITVVSAASMPPGKFYLLPADIVERLQEARTPADVEAVAAEVAKRSKECAVVKVQR